MSIDIFIQCGVYGGKRGGRDEENEKLKIKN